MVTDLYYGTFHYLEISFKEGIMWKVNISGEVSYTMTSHTVDYRK